VQFKLYAGVTGALDSMASVQRQPDREEEKEEPGDPTDALQACACEEKQTAAVEPPRVQQQVGKDESREDAVQSQLVQLWDCREYDEPTCVQTREVPPGEQLQTK
jgi:hypothetical protein